MLIIASHIPQRLARWKEGLQGNNAILEIAEPSLLRRCLADYRPQMLLLDLDFPGTGNAPAISKLKLLSPATKIVVLGQPASDTTEVWLFVAGVHGCCSAEVEPATLQRIIAEVRDGQLWIRRSLIPHVLEEMGSRIPGVLPAPVAERGAITGLTRREQQIAALVMRGETNKQIARRLDITERTVKAHLTGMFRKLGISDRLKLALTLSSAES